MTTPKQIAANRQNARASTGPKTAQGKSISSQNARKPGVYGGEVFVANELKRNYRQLRVDLYREWQPLGPTETRMVDFLVEQFWQLERIRCARMSFIEMLSRTDDGQGGMAVALDQDQTGAFAQLESIESGTLGKIKSVILTLTKLKQDPLGRYLYLMPPPKPPELPPPPIEEPLPPAGSGAVPEHLSVVKMDAGGEAPGQSDFSPCDC